MPLKGENMQTTATPSGNGGMAEKAAASIDRLSSTAHQAVDRVASAATTTAHQLGEKGEEWIATTDHWMEGTRGYVRQHPLAALGMALAVGFLLSRLTR
jgi:ElaB/YqjD/DUF883 family membrane-anchored ribosome-binding protein